MGARRPRSERKKDGTLREVEEIVLKLLEKDPDRRYKSALDVREALEHARRTIKSHDMPLPGWKIDRSTLLTFSL